MNHDAYENQMINSVNRHADGDIEIIPVTNQFTKTDAKSLWLGLKRVIVALLTAASFALTGYTFYAVATATGYGAVALFIAALVLTLWSFALLYAQGVVSAESQGDNK